MPLLKYICDECKHVFEELTSPDKKPKCPACKSGSTRRFYQGKCYFGGAGHKGGGSCSKGSCSSCRWCSA